MTLDEVAEAINAETDESGVKASVLKVSATSYMLILSSAETGETITASSVSGDDVLVGLGLLDDEGAFADELQAAQQAIFSIDGVEVTRSSNDVDDVLDGVTLHLYQETPDDTSITVEVGTDLSTVKEAISALVDAYNAYREFASRSSRCPPFERGGRHRLRPVRRRHAAQRQFGHRQRADRDDRRRQHGAAGPQL